MPETNRRRKKYGVTYQNETLFAPLAICGSCNRRSAAPEAWAAVRRHVKVVRVNAIFRERLPDRARIGYH